MPLEFDKAWSDLNRRLTKAELSLGLPAALYDLERYHRENGFIDDKLRRAEHYTFYHSDHAKQFFRVQYNPRRALRFAREVSNDEGSLNRNGGCQLCRENVRQQQQGAQLGYNIEVCKRAYYALMNPFPLLPAHVVIASTEHRSQDWRFRHDDGVDIAVILEDLVMLGARLPGYLGFYNGVDAGASIKGHLHYHFAIRPNDVPAFPLEMAAQKASSGNGSPALTERYPLEAAVWRGNAEDILVRATSWILRWGERSRSRIADLTANLIVTHGTKGDGVALYFVPRDRTRSTAKGLSSVIGGLEVLGEIVLSRPEDKVGLNSGLIDYSLLEAALASAHTPLEAN